MSPQDRRRLGRRLDDLPCQEEARALPPELAVALRGVEHAAGEALEVLDGDERLRGVDEGDLIREEPAQQSDPRRGLDRRRELVLLDPQHLEALQRLEDLAQRRTLLLHGAEQEARPCPGRATCAGSRGSPRDCNGGRRCRRSARSGSARGRPGPRCRAVLVPRSRHAHAPPRRTRSTSGTPLQRSRLSIRRVRRRRSGGSARRRNSTRDAPLAGWVRRALGALPGPARPSRPFGRRARLGTLEETLALEEEEADALGQRHQQLALLAQERALRRPRGAPPCRRPRARPRPRRPRRSAPAAPRATVPRPRYRRCVRGCGASPGRFPDTASRPGSPRALSP